MKSFQVADFNAPLREVDQPTPQPSGTQVLLKVKAAGVCHSDLHIWEGGYDLGHGDRKSTRLNSSHLGISYAVFCLKKKKGTRRPTSTGKYNYITCTRRMEDAANLEALTRTL